MKNPEWSESAAMNFVLGFNKTNKISVKAGNRAAGRLGLITLEYNLEYMADKDKDSSWQTGT